MRFLPPNGNPPRIFFGSNIKDILSPLAMASAAKPPAGQNKPVNPYINAFQLPRYRNNFGFFRNFDKVAFVPVQPVQVGPPISAQLDPATGQPLPPGAMPPGAMPPGAMPPGAMPPGAMPPGAMPPVDPATGQPLPPEAMPPVDPATGQPLPPEGQPLVGAGPMPIPTPQPQAKKRPKSSKDALREAVLLSIKEKLLEKQKLTPEISLLTQQQKVAAISNIVDIELLEQALGLSKKKLDKNAFVKKAFMVTRLFSKIPNTLRTLGGGFIGGAGVGNTDIGEYDPTTVNLGGLRFSLGGAIAGGGAFNPSLVRNLYKRSRNSFNKDLLYGSGVRGIRGGIIGAGAGELTEATLDQLGLRDTFLGRRAGDIGLILGAGLGARKGILAANWRAPFHAIRQRHLAEVDRNLENYSQIARRSAKDEISENLKNLTENYPNNRFNAYSGIGNVVDAMSAPFMTAMHGLYQAGKSIATGQKINWLSPYRGGFSHYGDPSPLGRSQVVIPADELSRIGNRADDYIKEIVRRNPKISKEFIEQERKNLENLPKGMTFYQNDPTFNRYIVANDKGELFERVFDSKLGEYYYRPYLKDTAGVFDPIANVWSRYKDSGLGTTGRAALALSGLGTAAALGGGAINQVSSTIGNEIDRKVLDVAQQVTPFAAEALRNTAAAIVHNDIPNIIEQKLAKSQTLTPFISNVDMHLAELGIPPESVPFAEKIKMLIQIGMNSNNNNFAYNNMRQFSRNPYDYFSSPYELEKQIAVTNSRL